MGLLNSLFGKKQEPEKQRQESQELAEIAAKQGLKQKAIDAFEALDRALESDPDNTELWVDKGLALFNVMGRNEDALAYFDRAFAIDSTCARAWIGKGALWAHWVFMRKLSNASIVP